VVTETTIGVRTRKVGLLVPVALMNSSSCETIGYRLRAENPSSESSGVSHLSTQSSNGALPHAPFMSAPAFSPPYASAAFPAHSTSFFCSTSLLAGTLVFAGVDVVALGKPQTTRSGRRRAEALLPGLEQEALAHFQQESSIWLMMAPSRSDSNSEPVHPGPGIPAPAALENVLRLLHKLPFLGQLADSALSRLRAKRS